jgi:hypothetical protein
LCYLSVTAGQLADAAPVGNADVVKVAGITLSETEVFIMPLVNTQAGIANPTDLPTALTAIASIIDVLQANGLIAVTA